MTIKKVNVNYRKKCLEIQTARELLDLPFSKLRVVPSSEDPIAEIYVDEDFANEAVTFRTKSGLEDTVHVDAFLDYNEDPDYMKKLELYKMTSKALELIESSNVSKREIARRLSTSPPQLYRLLDTSNYSKSIDQMLRLIVVLGGQITFTVQAKPETKIRNANVKFKFLKPDQFRTIPEKSRFRSLLASEEKRAA